MVCPECGAKLETGARFCHQCGWDSKLAAAGKASSTAGARPAWKRWTMALTLVGGLLLMGWIMLMPRNDSFVTLAVGQQAPDFELTTLEGETVKLSELRGQPVVLNFWASWCGPCRQEMPDFQAVHDRYKDAGLKIYGINVGESTVAVQDFLSKVNVNFPTLIDRDESVQTAYKILPLPATFFIDRNGTIRQIYQSQMSAAQIESESLRLMAVR